MIAIAAVAGVALVVLAVGGLPVLALLPDRLRHALVPGTPVLGAAFLVVALHLTSLVVGVRAGVLVVAVAGAAVLVARRRSRWWRLPRRRLAMAVVALAVGAVPFGLAVEPLVRAGDATVVQPTYNNDAFAYVTLTDWLARHRALDRPDPGGGDPPVFGYSRTHIDVGLRVGEELAQAAVATVLGRQAADTWYPTMAVWVLLLPAAFAAGALLLGLSELVGLAGGLVAGTSAVLLMQAFTQNSASLLGIALVVPAVAAVVAALDGDAPLWLAALLATALVATYTEYLPLLAPALAVYALVRHRRRALAVAAWSLALGPLVWFDAVRSLTHNAGFTGPSSRSAFLDVDWPVRAARALGLASYDARRAPVAATVAVALAVAALVASAVRRRAALWGLVAAGSAAAVAYLGTVHRFPYGHQRAVEIAHPLWVFMAAVGAAGRRATRVAAVAVAAVYVPVNVATVRPMAPGPLIASRHLDDDLRGAERWFEQVAGPDGGEGMVVDPEFFSQHWIAYLLRDRPATAYPFVFQDYHGIPRYRLAGSRLRRYALVSRAAWVSADPGVEVGGNRRYRFLDLSKGEALVAAPAWHFYPPEPRGQDRWASWMADDGEVVALHTPGVRRAAIDAWALDDAAPLSVTATVLDGPPVGTWSFGPTTTTVAFDLPAEPTVRLLLDNAGTAAAPTSGTDPRKLSLYVEEIRRSP